MTRKGFLLAELVVSLALLGLLMAGLAVSMNGFSAFNHSQWMRQRCTAAAQAQLDSLVVTGEPIETSELERLWPDVAIVVERVPGETPWEGFELVQVTAAARPGAKRATVRLARYLRPEPPALSGEQP